MSIKTTIEKAGHGIAETAAKVGHGVREGVEQAADWTKEKINKASMGMDETARKMNEAKQPTDAVKAAAIRPKMEVIASCGTRIGKVDHLDANDTIKLMKNDPKSGGEHHWIPTSWVERVDGNVHLKVNSEDAMNRWTSDPVACGSCGS